MSFDLSVRQGQSISDTKSILRMMKISEKEERDVTYNLQRRRARRSVSEDLNDD